MWFLDLESSRFVPTWGFFFLYLGYGMILMACVTTPVGRGAGFVGRLIARPPFTWIAQLGFYSYPVYLFHIDVVRGPLLNLFPSGSTSWDNPALRWVIATSMFVILAGAVGIFFNKIMERPILALRERWFPGTQALVQVRIHS